MELKLKKIIFKDMHIVSKFLTKTGMKKQVFEALFPKNDHMPKDWPALRKHVQTKYSMTDTEFVAFQKSMDGNFNRALLEYVNDFPAPDMGESIIGLLIEMLGEEKIYEELVKLLAYFFETDGDAIESLSIKELIELVKGAFKDQDFMESLEQSMNLKNSAE